jgi:Cu(I)/Ag(I) efflux system membrane fusion protein
MFVQARFSGATSENALAVPRSAVIDTGNHTLVYVAHGNGVFEAKVVQLGAAAGDYYPVLAGLRGGERVVTEGNFMLDSQTHITGGMSGMFGGSKEFNQQQGAPESAQWKVSFRSDPTIPKGESQAILHVSVEDDAGKPVTNALVRVSIFMPAMPTMGMSEMREATTLSWKGTDYAGAIQIPTSGAWAVTVEVSRGGQALTTYRTSLNAK